MTQEPHDIGLAAARLSPSFRRDDAEAAAFELKFEVAPDIAALLIERARAVLTPDEYSDPALDHAYRTTTLYLDNVRRDVLHRASALGGRKLRVRRYGDGDLVHLEEKIRVKDRVSKRRVAAPLDDWSHADVLARSHGADASWFVDAVRAGGFAPTCRVSYLRTAFYGVDSGSPIRMTLDRDVRGAPCLEWNLDRVTEGVAALPGSCICEFKFRTALAPEFKRWIAEFSLVPATVSKYRRTMRAAGLLEGSETDENA